MKAARFPPAAAVLTGTKLGSVPPASPLHSTSGCHLTSGEVPQTAFRCVSPSSEVMA